jgi:hypothetical protein
MSINSQEVNAWFRNLVRMILDRAKRSNLLYINYIDCVASLPMTFMNLMPKAFHVSL